MATAVEKKKHPRTGEVRAIRQRLGMDAMPLDVLEAVKRLRAKWGMGWMEIERLSSLPYNADWDAAGTFGKSGFVNWGAMPEEVLAAFPHKRIPHTNLHRWYDLRVEQTQKEMLALSVRSRELAQAFAAANIAGADEAVINAARDVIFSMLRTDEASQLKAAKGLIALAEVMQAARTNTIKERKVAVDERKLVQLEKDAELKRKRLEQETDSVAKKLAKGGAVTVEDLNRLRQRTFGLPPVPATAG